MVYSPTKTTPGDRGDATMAIASFEIRSIVPNRSDPFRAPYLDVHVLITAPTEFAEVLDGYRLELRVPKAEHSTIEEVAETVRSESARRLRAIADDLERLTLAELEGLDSPSPGAN